MTENTVFIRKAEIMTADMNGDTVMMDIETGKYYNLGAVGGRIWELLENPMTVNQLADNLITEYSVSREQCISDTLPFLKDLFEHGLISKV